MIMMMMLMIQATNVILAQVGRMNDTTEEVHFTTDVSAENAPEASSTLMFASTIVGLVSSVTGMFANAVVFVVLVFARRHFGSTVNTLLTHQTAIDLFACTFLTVGFMMHLPGAPKHYLWLGEIGNYVVCFLLYNRALPYWCLNAEKIGLALTACRRWYDTENNVLRKMY